MVVPACARSTSRARSSTRDELLGSGVEVLELDLAVGELVADDHREMGAVPGRRLQLLPELALRELRPGRDPGRPEERRDPEPVGSGVRVGADHDGDRRRRIRDGRRPLRLEGKQHPVEAEPEPDPRRRPAAEQLDEPVVAAAAADRLLLALAALDVELERGPGVVVEAADEARLEAEATPDASRCARTPAKCAAQASQSRSVIRGAPR